MQYILGFIGFIVGLFAWSSLIGTLFATIPINLKAKKNGYIHEINKRLITGQLVVGIAIITLMYIVSPALFYGSLFAGFIILFNINKLREEAVENLFKQQAPRNRSRDIDSLYGDAIHVVSKLEKASASVLQKELNIGYANAARLLEKMEDDGILGHAEGARPRKINKRALKKYLES